MRGSKFANAPGHGEAVLYPDVEHAGPMQRLRSILPDSFAWADLAKLAIISVQLGFLVLLIYQFKIENRVFYRDFMVTTFCGFVIHHLLPIQYRLPFFFALSLSVIGLIFGLFDGAWLVGIGLVLVAACHIPIRFQYRIALIAVLGLALAAMRSNMIGVPWSTAIWPILGSMFMFRLIVYLYDLRHQKGPVNVWQTLSYFFLLPNVCFPMFPVVDYSAFKRSHYNRDAFEIYQIGIDWIFRGVIHLIIYRLVDAYLMLSPDEVESLPTLAQYFLATYLLYLRISGQFHIIVGILRLFGFNLAETHRLYYLSSSFNDFWRRINIYWKDFVMKLFFNPTYFALKHRGQTTALTVSVLVTFFATWLLHSYQWFWLRGSVLLTVPDVMFWSILALLLVANTLHEHRHGRVRTLGKPSWTPLAAIWLALRTAATFTVLCILWSLWSSHSVADWLRLWSDATVTWQGAAVLVLYALAGIGIFGALAIWSSWRAQGEAERQPWSLRSASTTGASILLVYLIGNPVATMHVNASVQEVVAVAQTTDLNRRDAATLQRGYYEELIGVKGFNSQLWDVYMKKPLDWPGFYETEAARPTADLMKYEARPSVQMLYHGANFQTNRWAMRDREYTQAKPADTYRVAILGSSQVMGSGVSNDEIFESLVEARLNLEQGDVRRYEILNFAVAGWDPIQQVMLLEKVFSFEPDAIYLVAHKHDVPSSTEHLAEAVRDRVTIPFPYLRELAQSASVDPDTLSVVAEKRLKPHGLDIQSWAYRRIVEESRSRNVRPVYVLVATLEDSKPGPQDAELLRRAEAAGFETLNLSDIYVGQELGDLKVAEWDWHPNARGHALIAERLYAALGSLGRP